jgi:hypothetical protein
VAEIHQTNWLKTTNRRSLSSRKGTQAIENRSVEISPLVAPELLK